MGTTNTLSLWRFLPLVVVATLLVAGLPILTVWVLDLTGTVESPFLLIGLSFVAALGFARVGRWLWESRPASKDLLFSELMIWGWLRRLLIERKLSSAVDLLGVKPSVRNRGRAPKLDADRCAGLLTGLAVALEARDPYLHGHSRRVARNASMVAKKMGLPKGEVAMIRTAAAVHDVGKLETPIELLHKPGQLTDEEFETIKLHATNGERLVRPVFGAELASIVAHHHERLDGTGYPDRLAGDAIPLGSRIIAVADTFDAITSTRSYRSAKAHKMALEILRKEAGKQLDPDAVKAFCDCYSGARPLAIWAGVSAVPQRVFTPLVGELHAAGGAAAKVMAATAATAAVGGAAVGHSDLSDSLRSMFSSPGSAAQTAFVTPSLSGLPSSADGERFAKPQAGPPSGPALGDRNEANPSRDGSGSSAETAGGSGSGAASPGATAPPESAASAPSAPAVTAPGAGGSSPSMPSTNQIGGQSEDLAPSGQGHDDGQGEGQPGGETEAGQSDEQDPGAAPPGQDPAAAPPGQDPAVPPDQEGTPPAEDPVVTPDQETAPPAEDPVVPPDQEPAPPAEDPVVPPDEGEAPPDQGGTPPGHGGTPPGHGGTPPGHGGTPPGHGGTPPGHGGTPPGQGGTPPGQGETPPGHGGTPPGHGGTPPGQGGTPPGQGGTPPGHGGTPPDENPVVPPDQGTPPDENPVVPPDQGTPPPPDPDEDEDDDAEEEDDDEGDEEDDD